MGQVTVESTTDVELGNVQLNVGLTWPDQPRSSWPQISMATDAAMLGAAVIFAGVLSRGSAPTMSLGWAVVLGLLTLVTLYRKGLYRPPLQLRIIDTTLAIVTATGVAMAVTISLRVILTDSAMIAEQSVRLWLLATALLTAGRVALVVYERRARRAGKAGSPTLIVGAGKVGRLLAKRLAANREFGLRPIGFLDKEPLASDANGSALSVLGASWDFDRIVREHHVEHVVFTFSTAPTEVFLRLLKRCEELGVRTSLVPRLYEKATCEATIECLGGIPLVTSHARDPRGWQFNTKYALDRLAAVLMIAVVAPLFAVLAVAVWISLSRPIFYRQERVGRDGKRFAMLKFRSMRLPGKIEDEPLPAKTEDEPLYVADGTAPGGVEGADRRTRVGALMRQLSLDELPQLVNVVKGEMSFIGPRPERPEFVEVFEENVHRYGERHRVKSGITGWAQVNGLRGKTSIADRVEWDNYYIENWSLWLDFKIMLLTFVAVLRVREVE
jgi:exopolysaccharide biosynthesis polyprenyl glycosylphosphotransferase